VSLGRSAAAGVLAGAALAALRVPPPRGRELRSTVWAALGGVVGFPVLTTLALVRTTSAHAAVVIAALPLVTAAFAVLRAGDRPRPLFWSAAGLAGGTVAGYALLRGGGEGGDLGADLLLAGAVLCAAFGYAEGAVLTRRRPGWQVVAWTLVLTLPLTVPSTAAALWLARAEEGPTAPQAAALAYQALVTAFLAYLLWYRGLALAGVARAAQVQNLQPLLTVGWSALLLGEPVGWPTLAAAVVVLACVVVGQRAGPAADRATARAPDPT
jgi:drug/metabolite transporter (DMT)-like permease